MLRRGRKLKRQRAKRAVGELFVAAFIVTCALIPSIGRLYSSTGSDGKNAYGSFLLPTEAGGFILAAVIAFAVGVGVTVWILKYRNNHENKTYGGNENEHNDKP